MNPFHCFSNYWLSSVNKTLKLSLISMTLLSCTESYATTDTSTVVSNTQVQSNQLSTNTTNIPGNAQDWGLTENEWQAYQKLMQGPAGKWYPQLTPSEVLGMFADNERDQKHFAEVAAKEQHDKIAREIKFNNVFHDAAHELYIDEPIIKPFDMSAFNPIKTKNTANTANPNSVSLQSGDHLALFVDAKSGLDFMTVPTLLSLIKTHSGVVLDVYCVGNVSDADIQLWAKVNNIPVDLVNKGSITLNHDNGKWKSSLSSGLLPQVLLVQNGHSQSVNLSSLH